MNSYGGRRSTDVSREARRLTLNAAYGRHCYRGEDYLSFLVVNPNNEQETCIAIWDS
jgi:hypothetical protein